MPKYIDQERIYQTFVKWVNDTEKIHKKRPGCQVAIEAAEGCHGGFCTWACEMFRPKKTIPMAWQMLLDELRTSYLFQEIDEQKMIFFKV